ncbi:hypothetical protein Tco_1381918 [Tanacetum coccineum]
MQDSHLNDETYFRMNVIDKVTEEELAALLDDSRPFLNTSEKINETSLDKEFEEFMTVNVKEIPEQEEEVENNFEELTFEGNLRIKTSIQDLPTDLKMKPLHKHLKMAFPEKRSSSSKFDIEVKNKRAENVTEDQLSWLENPKLEELREKDIDDNFPDETLINVSSNEKDKIPWFTDFANYLVGKILRKGLTYAQRCKFFSELKH